MSKSSLLTLRNVDIFYGRIHAVKRVSMHVNAGEIVALIGGNGAGKTSLLTTISGLVRPASGSVAYDGAEIHKARAERIVRMGVSHVPEGRLVFGPMSVADNLALGGYVRQNKDEARRDLEQIYAMFPVLAERRHQLAGTLSGGEQQMLAIGRALMAKPRLLLLDEPSMGLAPRIARDIFSHVVELKERLGLTVLLVEQNAKNALRIADRGYVLETGR
ncbi:MAG: ABC transporter ATP-binding protein, partial [Oceanidesulfovibrio sp.]